MFDFNDIAIKGADDLQKAFQVETSPESFKNQFIWMTQRWGLESCLTMLGAALFGNEDMKGLIQPTQRFVKIDPQDPGSDYRLEYIK